MDVSWDDLRLFLASWHAGSFSGAAEALGCSQATLSRRIAALEEALGQPLFDRTRRGLVPTEAARALQPHVAGMAGCVEAAGAELEGLSDEPSGVVRIAVPPGVAVDLLPLLAMELRRRHPAICLEVLSDNLALDLSLREAEIALRSTRPGGGDLVSRRLPDIPQVLCAAPSLIAALPEQPTLADVPLLQWSHELAHIPLARWIHQALDGRAPALLTNSFLAMRAAALAGVGAMLLPEVQATVAGLAVVPVDAPPCPIGSWYLVVPRPLRRIPRVAVVVALILEGVEALERGAWPFSSP